MPSVRTSCLDNRAQITSSFATVVGADRIARNGDTANKVRIHDVLIPYLLSQLIDRDVQRRSVGGTAQDRLHRRRAHQHSRSQHRGRFKVGDAMYRVEFTCRYTRMST